jgi:hypothetical protein
MEGISLWYVLTIHLAFSHCGPALIIPIVGLAFGTITIYLRCIYRVVELNAGLDSKLAQNEVNFMVIGGAIIGLSVLCVSIIHPAFIFTRFQAKEESELCETRKERS